MYAPRPLLRCIASSAAQLSHVQAWLLLSWLHRGRGGPRLLTAPALESATIITPSPPASAATRSLPSEQHLNLPFLLLAAQGELVVLMLHVLCTDHAEE